MGKTTTPAHPYGNLTDGYGDSLTIGFDSVMTGGSTVLGSLSFFHQASLISGGRIQFGGNYGVIGETTAQILARIADVIRSSSSMVMLCLARNDLDGTTPLATTQANTRQIITRLQAAGKKVVLLTVPPSSTTPLATSVFNSWLRRYAVSRGVPVADIHAALVDPTNGNYQLGLSTDGKHPTAKGARVGGQKIIADILQEFPASHPLFVDATDLMAANLLSDGLFLADADANGVANNWGSVAGGAAFSLVADANIVGNYQRTTKNAVGTSNVFQTINAGFAVGDRLAFAYRVRATMEAGGLNFNGRLNFTGSTGPARCGVTGWASDLPDGSAFYYEPVVPAGTTSLGVEFGTSSPGTGQLDIAQATLLNLTALGINTL